MEKIGDGAEAVVYRKGGAAVKVRPKKAYRHPLLDEALRKSRTRVEARLLQKAREKGAAVPEVLGANERDGTLEIAFLEGRRLRDVLDAKNCGKWCVEAGRQVALLHKANIIHGDLTTSNFIVSSGKLWLIDFGLGFSSERDEDKAVDIHVFKEAMESKHFAFWEQAWNAFLKGYAAQPSVLKRLETLEGRGRYRKLQKKAKASHSEKTL